MKFWDCEYIMCDIQFTTPNIDGIYSNLVGSILNIKATTLYWTCHIPYFPLFS